MDGGRQNPYWIFRGIWGGGLDVLAAPTPATSCQSRSASPPSAAQVTTRRLFPSSPNLPPQSLAMQHDMCRWQTRARRPPSALKPIRNSMAHDSRQGIMAGFETGSVQGSFGLHCTTSPSSLAQTLRHTAPTGRASEARHTPTYLST